MHTSISSSLRTKRKEYPFYNLAIRALEGDYDVGRFLLWVGQATMGKKAKAEKKAQEKK